MSSHKILITGALHESAIQAFKANPKYEVNYFPDCDRETLFRYLNDTDVLVSRSETDVDVKVIEAAPKLKLIARAAVGVGNIDIEYATKRGILVINCPGQNTNSAAELTMALVLGMFRWIPQAHGHLKSGGWDRHRFSGRELRGKNIGIVGLGNVGHRVAKFAKGFDMEVYAYDPYISPEIFQRHGVKAVDSLMELAKLSDVLTLHVPLNRETKKMLNRSILEAMPKGSYLINAARGGIFEEEVAVELLNNGHLAGAAIDTFVSEPKPLESLVQHPKVWCSPHIGASTLEAQIAIANTIVNQVNKALEGGVVDYPVNLPAVGVMDQPILKSYAVLSEKLGSVLGQILDFNPVKFEISYRGGLVGNDPTIVRLAFSKGFVAQTTDEYISFVNVMSHLTRMGITIEEKEDPSFSGYKSAIKITAKGASQESLSVGGIVFDDNLPRLSLINDFYFEVEPKGNLILIENQDRPGVVGDVGQYLAKRAINIDSFVLSRNKKGGKAMALVRTDSPIKTEDVDFMSKITNVLRVRSVEL